jgi:hypothetical protein
VSNSEFLVEYLVRESCCFIDHKTSFLRSKSVDNRASSVHSLNRMPVTAEEV